MNEVAARSSSESRNADAPTPSSQPVRNLVICCDGTGNVWGNEQDTNVVRLVRACAKTSSQIVYYDPGVGTASEFPGIGWFEAFKVRIQRLIGLAFGGGIYADIGSAYAFLIRNYREGDRIWVFGFSRGAFTARAVAGMVNLFGVVRPAGEVMIPVLLRIYFSDRSVANAQKHTRQQLADDIRRNFADEPGSTARVYFTGVWDTVESVGGLRMIRISSSTSTVGKAFDHVRHAVAAAEYRAKYEPRLYPDPNRDEPGWVEIQPDGSGELEVGRDKPAGPGQFEYRPGLKQLYFPGAHSDVGGSYEDRGLSDCSLAWMLHEAKAKGLDLLDGHDEEINPLPEALAHDQVSTGWTGMLWALTGLRRRAPAAPALQHSSLRERLAAGLEDGLAQPPLQRSKPFWLALVLVVLTLWMVAAQTGGLNPGKGTSAFDLLWQQLTAFSAGARERLHAIYAGQASKVLLMDLAVILSYSYLGCILVAWSVRRLRYWHLGVPADARSWWAGGRKAHYRLWQLALFVLLAAPLADLLENGLTYHCFGAGCGGMAGLSLSLATLVKVLALVAVLALVVFAAILGRRQPGVARVVPAAPTPEADMDDAATRDNRDS